jgi:hypothetical protein
LRPREHLFLTVRTGRRKLNAFELPGLVRVVIAKVVGLRHTALDAGNVVARLLVAILALHASTTERL